jgi:hypothetical protein
MVWKCRTYGAQFNYENINHVQTRGGGGGGGGGGGDGGGCGGRTRRRRRRNQGERKELLVSVIRQCLSMHQKG